MQGNRILTFSYGFSKLPSCLSNIVFKSTLGSADSKVHHRQTNNQTFIKI